MLQQWQIQIVLSNSPISVTLLSLMLSFANYMAQGLPLNMVSAEGGHTMGMLGSKLEILIKDLK